MSPMRVWVGMNIGLSLVMCILIVNYVVANSNSLYPLYWYYKILVFVLHVMQ